MSKNIHVYQPSQKISSKLLAMMIWGFGAENRRGVSEDFHIWIHIFIEYIYNMQTLCFYPMKILFLITINWELSFSSNKTKSNLIVTFWKWGPYHIKALETCLVQPRRNLKTLPTHNICLKLSESRAALLPDPRTKCCSSWKVYTISTSFFLIFMGVLCCFFFWLCWELVAACTIFSYSMWDLVPWSGLEPGPPALGTQSLSHWTMRQVPQLALLE